MSLKLSNNIAYLYAKRKPYQPLFSLSQNHPIDIELVLKRRDQLKKGKSLRQQS